MHIHLSSRSMMLMRCGDTHLTTVRQKRRGGSILLQMARCQCMQQAAVLSAVVARTSWLDSDTALAEMLSLECGKLLNGAAKGAISK